MKKKLFIIAAAAMLLGMTACQKEQITPNSLPKGTDHPEQSQ